MGISNTNMNFTLLPIFVNFSMALASVDTRGVGKGYPHPLAFLKTLDDTSVASDRQVPFLFKRSDNPFIGDFEDLSDFQTNGLNYKGNGMNLKDWIEKVCSFSDQDEFLARVC